MKKKKKKKKKGFIMRKKVFPLRVLAISDFRAEKGFCFKTKGSFITNFRFEMSQIPRPAELKT